MRLRFVIHNQCALERICGNEMVVCSTVGRNQAHIAWNGMHALLPEYQCFGVSIEHYAWMHPGNLHPCIKIRLAVKITRRMDANQMRFRWNGCADKRNHCIHVGACFEQFKIVPVRFPGLLAVCLPAGSKAPELCVLAIGNLACRPVRIGQALPGEWTRMPCWQRENTCSPCVSLALPSLNLSKVVSGFVFMCANYCMHVFTCQRITCNLFTPGNLAPGRAGFASGLEKF